MANPRNEPHGRTALVLYGSETGSAKDVAEELGRICERLRFETQVAEMNDIDVRQLLRHDIAIFAISTTGQGDLPANSQTFWKILRSVRLPPGCLKKVKFVSFGLGDTSYPKFNWAHRKLHNRLLQLGARSIYERGESDEQHPEGIDGTFLPWSLGLRQRLIEVFPLPYGEVAIPDDAFLEPKWILERIADLEVPSNAARTPKRNCTSTEATATFNLSEAPPDGLFDVPNGIVATVESNVRLTPSSHWQDVRHLNFRLRQNCPYVPGDVLAIYPKNFPSDVEHFLELMDWTAIADTAIRFAVNPIRTPTRESSSSPLPNRFSSSGHVFTLRELLTNHLDIMSIPRRSFFAQLLHYTNDPFHRERLQEFTNPEYVDELYDYTTRPRRSILEVLDEFTSVNIPWQKVCSVIPTMSPRQFSIASGGALKASMGQEGTEVSKVELLVAIVKYRTVIKRIRQGVATRYIASLRPGQQITVSFVKGALGFQKDDIARPVVMVGPGTGVAPMRSLIYERMAVRAEIHSSPISTEEGDVLFFGCRNREADFFFEDEWKRLGAEVGLCVSPAFSRDQRQKVYVQDLIREQAKRVYHALADCQGLFYVCGSSGKMPQAVREALIEVFQQEGQMTRAEAEAYLVNMEKDSRYKQETW